MRTEEYTGVCSFKLKFDPHGISGKHCCGTSKESEIEFKILSVAEAEIKCVFCGYSVVFVYSPNMEPTHIAQNIEHTLRAKAMEIHTRTQSRHRGNHQFYRGRW